MVIKVKVEDLVKEAKGKGVVKIILQKDFDESREHPLKKYFERARIDCLFEKSDKGENKLYTIYLSKIEIVYPG